MSVFTLQQLAGLVGGRVHGDPATPIHGANTIRDALAGEITLAQNREFAAQLNRSPAAAAVVPAGLAAELHEIVNVPLIGVEHVSEAFARIVEQLRPPRRFNRCGISERAEVHPATHLEEDVHVHPGAFIDEDVSIGSGTVVHSGARILAGCRIGRRVTVFPNAVLYENTQIGDDCILHANSVIGAYGFGYDSASGRHVLSAQLGNVILEDGVEIGACTTVDRGTYGPTIIGEGSKLDNHVMVGHNCRIGKHNLLCSQVGIAGSCTTGDRVVMAGQVGIGDHLEIGERSTLGAKAGVMSSIPAGEAWVGIPATPMREQMHKQAALAKLPQMRKEFRRWQQKLEQLERERPSGPKQDAA